MAPNSGDKETVEIKITYKNFKIEKKSEKNLKHSIILLTLNKELEILQNLSETEHGYSKLNSLIKEYFFNKY